MAQSYKLSLTFMLIMILVGCNVTTPPDLSVRQSEVIQSERVHRHHLSSFSKTKAEILAKDYLMQNLNQPLRLLITYTENVRNAERNAKDKSREVEEIFRKLGIKHIHTEYLATTQAEANQLIISYPSYVARAPIDCREMPTENGAQSDEINKNYKMGCGIQSALVQQIADPKDLLGRAGVGRGDAKRTGIVSEPYMTGVQNDPMDGLRSSDVSGQ